MSHIIVKIVDGGDNTIYNIYINQLPSSEYIPPCIYHIFLSIYNICVHCTGDVGGGFVFGIVKHKDNMIYNVSG